MLFENKELFLTNTKGHVTGLNSASHPKSQASSTKTCSESVTAPNDVLPFSEAYIRNK